MQYTHVSLNIIAVCARRDFAKNITITIRHRHRHVWADTQQQNALTDVTHSLTHVCLRNLFA